MTEKTDAVPECGPLFECRCRFSILCDLFGISDGIPFLFVCIAWLGAVYLLEGGEFSGFLISSIFLTIVLLSQIMISGNRIRVTEDKIECRNSLWQTVSFPISSVRKISFTGKGLRRRLVFLLSGGESSRAVSAYSFSPRAIRALKRTVARGSVPGERELSKHSALEVRNEVSFWNILFRRDNENGIILFLLAGLFHAIRVWRSGAILSWALMALFSLLAMSEFFLCGFRIRVSKDSLEYRNGFWRTVSKRLSVVFAIREMGCGEGMSISFTDGSKDWTFHAHRFSIDELRALKKTIDGRSCGG